MTILDSDAVQNSADILSVTFYVKPVQDNFRTEKEGRPIFKDETFIRVLIPGRNDLTIDDIAREDHIQRFPVQWARFKNSQTEESQTDGTPVTQWAALTPAQALELRAKKFYTVEQVANCSDGQIQALGMDANRLRQKARTFLANAKNSALAQQQADEIEKLRKAQEEKDQKHAAEMAELRKMIEETRKPRGRPRKNKVENGPDPASVG